MSQLQDFVDREEELEIFLQMLSAGRQERVLDICAGGGTGKSYLLRRMRQECSAQDVPCALAEFASTWQPDPPKLMRELAEQAAEAWRRGADKRILIVRHGAMGLQTKEEK